MLISEVSISVYFLKKLLCLCFHTDCFDIYSWLKILQQLVHAVPAKVLVKWHRHCEFLSIIISLLFLEIDFLFKKIQYVHAYVSIAQLELQAPATANLNMCTKFGVAIWNGSRNILYQRV